ncbi:hypothetical protein [Paludibaculum fermentans]|uniref:hypothetical protein n=1 Tax=Paludibaculum fermentans TaxID=1473598 RepID=UPI003EB7CC64
MKILLSNFGAHVPSVPQSIEMSTGLVPPIVITEGHIDLDYSALLFFDRIILDRDCYERVVASRIAPFAHLRSSLRYLREEGYLDLVAFKTHADANRARIEETAAAASRDLDTWLPELRKQIENWEKIKPGMVQALGKHMTPWDQYSIGIECYLHETTGKIEQAEAEKLKSLVFSKKVRRSAGEREVLSRLLVPFLEMTHLNLVVGEVVGCPQIFDWQTLDGFYRKKFEYHLLRDFEKERVPMSAMKELFSLAFKRYTPQTAQEWASLLQDDRIRDLRERVVQARAEGENFDQDFAQDALAALSTDQTRLQQIQKIVGYITLPLELLPLVSRVVTEVATRYYEHKILKPHRWLYFSSRPAMHR